MKVNEGCLGSQLQKLNVKAVGNFLTERSMRQLPKCTQANTNCIADKITVIWLNNCKMNIQTVWKWIGDPSPTQWK